MAATQPSLRLVERVDVIPPMRSGIPSPRSALLGRERDVDALRALVQRSETGLVTLLGPGGVGKTRVAAQVATELTQLPRWRVHFVSLADVLDPNLVIPTIGSELGI